MNENENKLPSLDEIADYYKNITPKATPAENNLDETPDNHENYSAKTDSKNIDTPDLNRNFEPARQPVRQSHKKTIYIIATAAASAVIITAAFIFGNITAKPGSEADGLYLKMLKSDKKYLSAYERVEEVSAELEDLNLELEKKRSEAEDLSRFAEQQAQIQQKIYEMQSQQEQLEKDIESKQKTSSGLDAEIDRKAGRKTELTPGIYTVGKHIAPGDYIVTGNGSFTLSDGNGGFKQSSSLTNNDTQISLTQGDIIKLETTAVFKR